MTAESQEVTRTRLVAAKPVKGSISGYSLSFFVYGAYCRFKFGSPFRGGFAFVPG
jgi:hypothetical protein